MGRDPGGPSAQPSAVALCDLLAISPLDGSSALPGHLAGSGSELGTRGGAAKKQEKDYWRKNWRLIATPGSPTSSTSTLDLDLFPERSRYHVKGTYDLINASDQPLDEILLTGGLHWEKLRWTMDDKPYSPKNSAGLFIFTPPNGSLAPGEVVRIGFEHEGTYPRGISKKGGGQAEFILPSAVVLTGFRRTIVPVLGYVEDAGIDDENRHDPRSIGTISTRDRPTRSLGARMRLHDQDHDHRSGRLHAQLGGNQDGRHRQGRPPHRRLGERPPGEASST